MFLKHANLKNLTSTFLAVILCGCSSVQTSDLPPAELQDQIATRQLVHVGDHVTVTTSQGITYDLEITRVTEKTIEGLVDATEYEQTIDENADISMQPAHRSPVEIRVADISIIETREPTPAGRVVTATGAAVALGGVMYFAYVLLPALLVSAIVGL